MADEAVREKVDLINEFCVVTGVDNPRAQLYLEASGWDIDLALSNFYEDTDENVEQEAAPPIIMHDDESSPASPPIIPPPPVPAAPFPSATPAKRFATLSNITKEENSDDEGQAFYAGGSERSGQQVLGPGKKKKDKSDIVSEMFKAAKEHGAHVLEANETFSKKKQVIFKGTGYKLGSDEGNSVPVVQNSSLSEPERSVEMSLKMWKNGFSIDDGPLREYSDPSNVGFLESIKRGEIPQELHQRARGEVSLNMEDHQNQEYEPPRRSAHAFTGEGHRLGNPAPVVVTGQNGHSPPSVDECKSNEGRAQQLVEVNEKQPTTSIQIRLADGSRLIAKLNLTHTVGDIRRYLVTARPQFEDAIFSLLTTFPNKELTDDSLSIKEANLLNAVIVQKLD